MYMYIYISLYTIQYSIYLYTRDVNDAEILMPSRDYWFLMPSRYFHFRKKTSPG